MKPKLYIKKYLLERGSHIYITTEREKPKSGPHKQDYLKKAKVKSKCE